MNVFECFFEADPSAKSGKARVDRLGELVPKQTHQSAALEKENRTMTDDVGAVLASLVSPRTRETF